jgi:hypothetical protein
MNSYYFTVTMNFEGPIVIGNNCKETFSNLFEISYPLSFNNEPLCSFVNGDSEKTVYNIIKTFYEGKVHISNEIIKKDMKIGNIKSIGDRYIDFSRIFGSLSSSDINKFITLLNKSLDNTYSRLEYIQDGVEKLFFENWTRKSEAWGHKLKGFRNSLTNGDMNMRINICNDAYFLVTVDMKSLDTFEERLELAGKKVWEILSKDQNGISRDVLKSIFQKIHKPDHNYISDMVEMFNELEFSALSTEKGKLRPEHEGKVCSETMKIFDNLRSRITKISSENTSSGYYQRREERTAMSFATPGAPLSSIKMPKEMIKNDFFNVTKIGDITYSHTIKYTNSSELSENILRLDRLSDMYCRNKNLISNIESDYESSEEKDIKTFGKCLDKNLKIASDHAVTLYQRDNLILENIL